MKKLFFALIFVFAFSLFFLNAPRLRSGQAEEVTITTYYPAPKGVYHTIIADEIGIGTPDPEAIFEVNSTSDGILIPRMSMDDRDAIVLPPTSLLIYQTDDQPNNPHGYYYYDTSIPGWAQLLDSSGGGWWDSDNDIDIYNTNTGNVGIGTTDPQNRLDVEGGMVVGASYSGTNVAPADGMLIQGSVGIGTTNVDIGTKFRISHITNADDLVVDGGTGYVGVGTDPVGTTRLLVDGGAFCDQAILAETTADNNIGILGRNTGYDGSGIWGEGFRGVTGVANKASLGTGAIAGVYGALANNMTAGSGVYGAVNANNIGTPGNHTLQGISATVFRTTSPDPGGAGASLARAVQMSNSYTYYGIVASVNPIGIPPVYQPGDYAGWFIGPVKIDGDFNVTGNKSFEIGHPTKPGYKLVHSTLEGPEAAVFYRGEAKLLNGHIEVKLPDYFEALVRKENRTVQLTAKGTEPYLLSASEIKNGKFKVFGTKPNGEFFWEVKAVRSDVAPLKVEVKK